MSDSVVHFDKAASALWKPAKQVCQPNLQSLFSVVLVDEVEVIGERFSFVLFVEANVVDSRHPSRLIVVCEDAPHLPVEVTNPTCGVFVIVVRRKFTQVQVRLGNNVVLSPSEATQHVTPTAGLTIEPSPTDDLAEFVVVLVGVCDEIEHDPRNAKTTCAVHRFPGNSPGMQFSVDFDGFEELAAVFRELPKRVQTKVLRNAVNVGATPIVKQLRANARSIRETGLLAKSVGFRHRQYSKPTHKAAVNIIGVRSGFKRDVSTLKFNRARKKKFAYAKKKKRPRKSRAGWVPLKRVKQSGNKYRNPRKYFHLVEFGTRRSRAIPIFQLAMATSVQQGKSAMYLSIANGIMEEAKKLRKK